MTRSPAIFVVLTPIVLALLASPTMAQTTSTNRTFVSSGGQDSGLCSRLSPCRSFAYAIGVSPAGGELIALDPAGYGPVTIGKAITITGPGTGLAQISASGSGVTVSAGSGDAVTLRGVEIDGGVNGIELTSFGSVVVKDSVIRGSTYGISSFSSGTVTVANSTITNAGSIGIFMGGGGNLNLSNTTVRAAADVGVSVSGRVEVIDCTFVNPSATGLSIGGFAFVKGSVFAGNNVGVALASNTTVQFDTTTLTGNSTAISNINSNSSVQSYGNNNVVANATNVAGGAGVMQVTPN